MTIKQLKDIPLADLKAFADSLEIEYPINVNRAALDKAITAKCRETGTEQLVEDFLAAYNTDTPESGDMTVEEMIAATVLPEIKEKVTKDVDPSTKLKQEAMALVRFKLVCNDPSKSAIQGEMYSVSNRYIGSVKRFIPYSQEFYGDKGWHAERCIMNQLKSKMFHRKRTVSSQGGVKVPRTELEKLPMFTITELPPLTQEELKLLAKEQRDQNRLELK